MHQPQVISLLMCMLAIPTFVYAQEDIVKECEMIFPDLEVLGKTKFEQRYLYHKNLRDCYVLYNDPIWYSNDPDRDQRLIKLLEKPERETPIRNRIVQSDEIPQWIRDDATRWHQGKEKDSILSYGIRYMIDSKMINPSTGIYNLQNCDPDSFCISKSDYLRYSIKDSQIDDVITRTETFGEGGDLITVNSVEVSKSGKETNHIQTNSDGLIASDQKYYPFVHKVPLEIGSSIKSAFDIQITDEIVFTFKDTKRDALLAWDETEQYHEVIDKQTGVVLFAKQENRILRTEWTAKLVDTNVFTKEIKIQHEDMQIPPWFRAVVKWWTEEQVSDVEYLNGIGYLLKNKVMRV